MGSVEFQWLKMVPPCGVYLSKIVDLHVLMLEELKCGVSEIAKIVPQKENCLVGLKENPENASRVRARE